MTLRELQIHDSLGLPKFGERQAKAMIDMIRRTGKLISPEPDCEGRGIVIVGGGKYLGWTHVLCTRLRRMSCGLRVQVWHLGEKEMPRWVRPLFQKLDIELVDIHEVMKTHPARQMSGWIAKTYAVRHCPFEEVMFIDADCTPVVLPEQIFDNARVQQGGSLLFKDVGKHHPSPWGYVAFGITPLPYEFETGQFIWHKRKAWHALCWALWASEHTDVFYKTFFHGDKGLIEACFRSTDAAFVLGEHSEWKGYGIDHWLDGEHVFSHLMGIKRGEHKRFPWLESLFVEWESLSMGK